MAPVMSPLSSSTINHCRECGTALSPAAPDGFCPSCLIEGALRLGATPPLDAEDADAAPGVEEIIARVGVYDLLEEIGRGGMGVVYRARQRTLNRIVAVKMILSGQFAGRNEVLRFRAEAETAAKLNHSNIVAVHESGEQEGQHYFSMDFVQGRSLAEIVRDEGPLPARRAAVYAKTVAEAIHYAHQQGVLHRDLKPSNVLIDAEDRPRITDFGLAKHLRGDFGLTVTGQVLGSPHFMSPEQASGVGSAEWGMRNDSMQNDLPARGAWSVERSQNELEKRASQGRTTAQGDQPVVSSAAHNRVKLGPMMDVYGIGAILYHSLTGRPPFQAASVQEVLLQLRETEPVSPRRLSPSVPRDLETICLKCLEKEPRRRYQTAQERPDELSRFLSNEPLVARPVSKAERSWRWCRRKPVVAGLVVALNLAFVLGVAGVLWEWRRAVTGELNARQHRYVSDMNLVQRLWEEGNVMRAHALLTAHIPQHGKPDLRGFEWRYLWKLCSQDESLFVFSNFADPVSDLAYSPDRKLLAAVGGHALTLLDLPSRQEVFELTDPDKNDFISRVAWSPVNSNLLVTGGSGGVVKLWNLRTKKITPFAHHPGVGNDGEHQETVEIGDLAFSPDGKILVVSSSEAGCTLRAWSVDEKRELWSTNLTIPPGAAALTLDGHVLVTGGGDAGNARAWDVTTGTELARFPVLHTGWVRCVAISPDGRTVATGANDNRLILWDYPERRSRFPSGDRATVASLAFSPDSRLLASGGSDGLIRFWSADSGKQVGMLRGHSGPVLAVTFTPDGSAVVSGGSDRTVRVWEQKPQRDTNLLLRSNRCINSLAFSPDGKVLATGSVHRNWTELWDVASRRWITKLTGHALDAPRAAFSPDGKILATGSHDKTIILWNPENFARVAVLSNSFGLGRIAFSPDSKVLAAASWGFRPPNGMKTLAFWDVTSRRRIEKLSEAAPDAGCVAFSNDGQLVAIGYTDGWVRLWDFQTGRKLGEFRRTGGITWELAFSPDSRLLASTAAENVALYDVVARHVSRILEAHTGQVKAVTFAPDGKTLASAAEDGTVRLWNLATGDIALVLSRKLEPVYSLAFSRDGTLLASGGLDGEVQLWPAASWEEINAGTQPHTN